MIAPVAAMLAAEATATMRGTTPEEVASRIGRPAGLVRELLRQEACRGHLVEHEGRYLPSAAFVERYARAFGQVWENS